MRRSERSGYSSFGGLGGHLHYRTGRQSRTGARNGEDTSFPHHFTRSGTFVLSDTYRRRLTLAFLAEAFSLPLPSAAALARKPSPEPPPIHYALATPDPVSHLAQVTARIPTGGKPSVALMMAVWSPGYYVEEDYATHLTQFSAATPDGRALDVHTPQPNRWRIITDGAPTIV